MSTPQIGTITLSESLAPDYMVNRLYKQSTMGDLKTEYSPQLDLCVPQDMTISFAVPETEEMKREKDVFEETITKYRQSKAAQQAGATKPTGKQDWNWQDVFEEMDSADKRYRDLDTDGVLGRLRQTIRKFGKFKEPAEGWMRLLPSDSWQGSLVCGGLKMVLNAAWHLGEIREEIGAAIEQIPETVDKVQTLLAIYDGAEIRTQHVSQMFVTILQILGLCLKWFMKNPTRKAFGSAFKGDAYYSDLTKKVQILKRLEGGIDDQSMRGLHSRTKVVVDRVSVVDEKVDQLKVIVVKEIEMTLRAQEREKMILESLEELRQQRLKEEKREKKARALEREREQLLRVQQARLAMNRRDWFLKCLEYDRLQVIDDLRHTLATGQTLLLDAQDRAAWTMREDYLIEWLSSPDSRLIVINGKEAQHATESAVSFFSAMLVMLLGNLARSSLPAIVLRWFCGRNVHSGVHDMTTSLLGQLLLEVKQPMPLEGHNADDFRDLQHVHTVVKILCACIKTQLAYSSVFLVIDSISFYEVREHVEELQYLYHKLSRLAHRWKGTYALKVLVSSPTQSSYLGTYDDEWKPQTLNVPDVVDGNLNGIDEAGLIEKMAEEVQLGAEE